MTRTRLLVLLLIAFGCGALAVELAAAAAPAARPALHTIYCRHGAGLPVGFEIGPGLPAGCPPGFVRA